MKYFFTEDAGLATKEDSYLKVGILSQEIYKILFADQEKDSVKIAIAQRAKEIANIALRKYLQSQISAVPEKDELALITESDEYITVYGNQTTKSIVVSRLENIDATKGAWSAFVRSMAVLSSDRYSHAEDQYRVLESLAPYPKSLLKEFGEELSDGTLFDNVSKETWEVAQEIVRKNPGITKML